MSVSNTPILLAQKSQAGIIQYYKACQMLTTSQWDLRKNMESIDKAYMREVDNSEEHLKAKRANASGDTDKLQNVTIPVVMPQVESAVVYQSSVFLTGSPIFGVLATPQYVDQAQAMESLILENSTSSGWVRQLVMFFRDGFKYNFSFIETSWERKTVAALETDVEFSTTQAKPKEVIWEGNTLKRLDPYNTFFDCRVPPAELHSRGEFVGYTELLSRIELKAYIHSLPDKIVSNVRAAFESPTGANISGNTGGSYSYFLPDVNYEALLKNQNKSAGVFDWSAWIGFESEKSSNIRYQNYYERTTIYAKILPSDFDIKVPAPNTPQIWKFVIINHQVIIYAERMTNAHGFLPVLCGQPLEDGLQFQTKSLATNVQGIQEITSGLMNSVIASRRRAISDRVLFDPSRISAQHINSSNPSAKIPIRPAAYGKPVGDSVYAFPFRDDQSGIALQEISQLSAMANMISGQNPVRQGQFVKGNKTTREFSDVMSNANGRDQLTAMMYEAQVFTPMKQIIKANYLQYQGPSVIYNADKQSAVEIDPVKLRNAMLAFKVSDGLIPTEKLMNGEMLTVVLQTFQASPELASQYNVGPMFSYLVKSQGADIKAFEKSKEQVAYEQAVMQWQQAVSRISEQLKGMELAQAQELMKSIPPQPLPEQFGYNVNQPSGGAENTRESQLASIQAISAKDPNSNV